MKNYLEERITVKQFRQENPKFDKTAERAMHYLMGCYASEEEDDYVIIEVEGYYCVAYKLDDFTPYELGSTIAPFDEKGVYPLQGLITEYAFKRYK